MRIRYHVYYRVTDNPNPLKEYREVIESATDKDSALHCALRRLCIMLPKASIRFTRVVDAKRDLSRARTK